MQLTGAQIVLECLKEQGVDTIFGYPGGTILNIYDELYKQSDNFLHILTSHEQGAANAADGYARSTGKVGVCFATSGPGSTNLVTGIATAYMDSVPMVAITCNVNLPLLGNHIRILPLIYLGSQFVQGMITNAANQGAQGKSMKVTFYIMYVVFFFMFYNAPSGLLIYWTFSNMLMMIQQVIINGMMKKKRAELEAAKANERPVFVPNKKKK